MGMHRDHNRKRPAHIKHNYRRQREKIKRRRAAQPQIVGEIPDADLQTPGQLRKLRTNPNANIELSGKRKRKILKQLRRQVKEQQQAMEVSAPPATADAASATASVKSSAKATKKTNKSSASSVAMETDQ